MCEYEDEYDDDYSDDEIVHERLYCKACNCEVEMTDENGICDHCKSIPPRIQDITPGYQCGWKSECLINRDKIELV